MTAPPATSLYHASMHRIFPLQWQDALPGDQVMPLPDLVSTSELPSLHATAARQIRRMPLNPGLLPYPKAAYSAPHTGRVLCPQTAVRRVNRAIHVPGLPVLLLAGGSSSGQEVHTAWL